MFHLRQGADDIADPVEAAGTDYCFYLIAEAGELGVREEVGGGLLDSFWFIWTLAIALPFLSFSIGDGRSRRKGKTGRDVHWKSRSLYNASPIRQFLVCRYWTPLGPTTRLYHPPFPLSPSLDFIPYHLL
jgi:hypothetical protein